MVLVAFSVGTAALYRRTPGTSDVHDIWLAWIRDVLAYGPIDGYLHIRGDYPPGASFVLWIVGHVATWADRDPRAILKIILFVFLAATTWPLALASGRASLGAFAQAALVTNSVGLMYLDIFTAPFLVGAVWAAGKRQHAAMIGLIGVACAMKWQPVVILPFAVVYLLLQRDLTDRVRWRRTAIQAASVLIVLAGIVTAIYGLGPLLDSFYRASRHNNVSNFGANPLWLLTWVLETAAPSRLRPLSPDGTVAIAAASRPLLRVLTLLTLIGYGTALRAYWRSRDASLRAFLRFALVGYLVYFMCSAGVHENHLFLANLLAILLVWQDPTQIRTAIVVALAANLNELAFYGWTGTGANRLFMGFDDTVLLAVAVSCGLGLTIWTLGGSARQSGSRQRAASAPRVIQR